MTLILTLIVVFQSLNLILADAAWDRVTGRTSGTQVRVPSLSGTFSAAN